MSGPRWNKTEFISESSASAGGPSLSSRWKTPTNPHILGFRQKLIRSSLLRPSVFAGLCLSSQGSWPGGLAGRIFLAILDKMRLVCGNDPLRKPMGDRIGDHSNQQKLQRRKEQHDGGGRNDGLGQNPER